MQLARDQYRAPDRIGAEARTLIEARIQRRLRSPDAPAVLVNMTSVLINTAGDIGDESALTYAANVLGHALETQSANDVGGANAVPSWVLHAQYNRANALDLAVRHRINAQALSSTADAEEPSADTHVRVERAHDAHAWFYRERAAEVTHLRVARTSLAAVADAHGGDADQKTRAATNLGNALSMSGRWLEAYERYAHAMRLDPTNGNAAGNAAQCLARAITCGLGPVGHLAAVYEKYRQIAINNRDRTIELAGPHAAELWDRLRPATGVEHLANEPSGDPYVEWVAAERLALTPVTDGLGTDTQRFDDVAISTISDNDPSNSDVPAIFAAANILTADYLAARRTAYAGLTMLTEAADGYVLHPEDTGTYVNTLDYAVYGEPVSLTLLGARSALDVLDKIAVTLNDYLKVGDDPGRIDFRRLWRGKGTKRQPTPDVRAAFWNAGIDAARVLALVELADDVHPGGLYARAQAVRNRSTHRLVRAHDHH
jgi:LA2681-like HEPN